MHLSPTALIFILVFAATILGFGYQNAGWDLGYAYGLLPQDIIFISATLIVLLIAFVIFDLWKRLQAKWLIAWLFIIVSVIVPTLLSVSHRRQTAAHLFVHDNPLQIEAALEFLFSGTNPYGQDYSTTPMGQWTYGVPYFDFRESSAPDNIKINPALFHLVSLPFGFLSHIPAKIISELVVGWFDARFVYLLSYFVMVFIGLRLISSEKKLDFFLIFAGNPILTQFFITGHNDILVISLLLLVIYLAHKRQHLLSALPLGLSIATKQIAWPFTLLYIVYLYFQKRDWRLLFKVIALAGLIASALILPFVLWDPPAFWRDTFLFVSGGLPTSYPIKGIGLSMVFILLGWIPNSLSAYPVGLWQLLLGLPVFIASVLSLKKFPHLSTLCTWFAIFYLVLIFASRFFTDNYLGVVVAFLLLGYYLQTDKYK